MLSGWHGACVRRVGMHRDERDGVPGAAEPRLLNRVRHALALRHYARRNGCGTACDVCSETNAVERRVYIGRPPQYPLSIVRTVPSPGFRA